ncbi:MAG: esterase/lipase family protein, partial [Steroidobacteraceae bacterium]
SRYAANEALTLLVANRVPHDKPGEEIAQPLLVWQSALNGVIGDRLEATANPLEIAMSLCRNGRAIEPNDAELGRAIESASGTLIVFVHGLGMSDLSWHNADGVRFGDRLEREGQGFSLDLRYNSGHRISANGREFSELLNDLYSAHASAIRRIVLIGHSMGGLVCRSTCDRAQRHELAWSAALDEVICLGTPHFGAPLERLGDWLSVLLAATPVTRSLARLANTRSAGVKDLRDGWTGILDRQRDIDTCAAEPNAVASLPFAERVHWRFVAATRGTRADGERARWLGDGLVPVPSALGQREDDPAGSLRVPATHRRVFTRMGHIDLLTDVRVYAQLRKWIARK